MSEAIVPVISYSEIERMAQAICKSGLFGIKQPDQAIALMLIAQAEGLHPALVARDYHIIQGRPALKADAILARFQQAGGKVEWTEMTDTAVEGVFSHPASPRPVKIRWTLEDAKRAGLLGKDNWRQYPRSMLRSRVISEGVRATYPGVTVGVYTIEEVQDMPPAGRGAPAIVEPEPPAVPMPKKLSAAQQAADPFPELIPESEMEDAPPSDFKEPAVAAPPRQKKSLAEVAAEHAAQNGDKTRATTARVEVLPPEPAKPTAKPAVEPESVPRPVASSPESDFLVTDARVLKTGTRTSENGDRVTWTLYVIKTAENVEFLTFSKRVFETATEAAKSGVRVMFDFSVRQNKNGVGTSNEATAITLLG